MSFTNVRRLARAAAVALLVILGGLLTPGCGESGDAPEAAAEARQSAARQRGARELALLHERRERREARMADGQMEAPTAEQLAAEAEEIAQLEQELALAMSGERPEPRESRPGSDGAAAQAQNPPGVFPQLLDPDPDARADAVFEADPDDDIEMLVVAMQDENEVVREAAAEQLGDSERDLALDALIGALQDEDEDVVLAAIAALEWRDDARAIPALRVALEQRSEPEIQEAVEEAIDWLEPD